MHGADENQPVGHPRPLDDLFDPLSDVHEGVALGDLYVQVLSVVDLGPAFHSVDELVAKEAGAVVGIQEPVGLHEPTGRHRCSRPVEGWFESAVRRRVAESSAVGTSGTGDRSL